MGRVAPFQMPSNRRGTVTLVGISQGAYDRQVMRVGGNDLPASGPRRRPGRPTFPCGGLAPFWATSVLLASAILSPQLALAAPEESVPLSAEGQAPAAPPPATRVTCLDDLSPEGAQRKGVQKRDFLKKNRFEMSALAGLYAADALSSTYAVGGSFAFFFAEDLGVELFASHSPVKFRLEEPFVGFGEPRRFTAGSAFSLLGALTFSPIHAKFRVTDATIVHGDIFLSAGAGRVLHDTVQGVAYQAGLGLRLYLFSRLAFRIELRDFVLAQEVLGVGRVTHNFVLLGGFGFWLG